MSTGVVQPFRDHPATCHLAGRLDLKRPVQTGLKRRDGKGGRAGWGNDDDDGSDQHARKVTQGARQRRSDEPVGASSWLGRRIRRATVAMVVPAIVI